MLVVLHLMGISMFQQRVVAFVVASVLLAAALPAHGRPGMLIAGTSNGKPARDGTLLELDPVTGAGDKIAGLYAGSISLAFNPRTGLLYGSLAIIDGLKPAASMLTIIDPDTGAVTNVGHIKDEISGLGHTVASMGFTEDGRLYGLSRRTQALIEIDPDTGLANQIGPGLGIVFENHGGDIYDGQLYIVGAALMMEKALYKVDLSIGVAEFIGPTGRTEDGLGVTVNGDGELMAVIRDSLYTLDPLTGTATLVGPTGFNTLASLEFVDDLQRLCPCDDPWTNHGQYVSCVTKEAKAYAPSERDELIVEAAQSDCGMP